jgi:hypothetical protein
VSQCPTIPSFPRMFSDRSVQVFKQIYNQYNQIQLYEFFRLNGVVTMTELPHIHQNTPNRHPKCRMDEILYALSLNLKSRRIVEDAFVSAELAISRIYYLQTINAREYWGKCKLFTLITNGNIAYYLIRS